MERPDAAAGGQVVRIDDSGWWQQLLPLPENEGGGIMDYYNDKQRSGWAVMRLAAIHGPWIAVVLAVLDFIGRAVCTR